MLRKCNLDKLKRLRQLCRSGAALMIRTESEVSLGDVAREVGVSRSTISRWERGLRRPGPSDRAMTYLDALDRLSGARR